jgi:uncharacterized protein (DUF736 family)
MEYDNNNTGALFRNETSTPENKQPTHTGKCEVNGKEMQIAGWMKEAKNGMKYLQLKFQEPMEKKEATADDSNASIAGDAIPF